MKKVEQKAAAVTDTFKLHLVEMALQKLHEQLLNRDDFKASPGDLIKLIEAHNAMQEVNGPSEVLVRWIERESDVPRTKE